jgi:hypothetical protein
MVKENHENQFICSDSILCRMFQVNPPNKKITKVQEEEFMCEIYLVATTTHKIITKTSS